MKKQKPQQDGTERIEGLDYSTIAKRKPNYFVGDVQFVIKMNGLKSAAIRRFIARDIKYIRNDLTEFSFSEVRSELAKGNEVRIGDTEGGIRIFPCLDKDLKGVTVVAQSYGLLRRAFRDKEWSVTNKGRFKVEEVVERTKNAGKMMMDGVKMRKNGVTPDLMVKCPKCGNEFRVGKTLQ